MRGETTDAALSPIHLSFVEIERSAPIRDMVLRLMAGVDPALLQTPMNALRLSLHPQGLAPRFDTPVEVTLRELTMETSLQADDFTRQVLQDLAAQG